MWLQLVENLSLIPTIFLLMIVILQYSIFIFKKKKKVYGSLKPAISILVPAHNEGKYLRETIKSILNSGYKGKKEIIVIDDGSTDNTPQIIREFEKKKLIKAIRTKHIGKSKALNKGLKLAKNEIIVTIDGDTKIKRGSLDKLVAPFLDKKVVATTGIVKVANTKKPITWFQRVEYLYFSFYKDLCDRLDGVIWASGTLSAFRRNWLNGFNPNLYMEDADIALRLIKRGYKIRYIPDAVAYTFVPESIKDFVKQRSRWLRGGIQIIKKYSDLFFNKRYAGVGFFTLPMMFYWYFHALIMGVLIFLQILLGYYNFYYVYGNIISFEIIKYFFYWFSFFGIVNLAYQMLIGNFPLKLLYILNILLVMLMYGIYIYSIRWSKEKVTTKDVVAFIFMFPYWILLMAVQNYSNVEWFRSKARNWWKK